MANATDIYSKYGGLTQNTSGNPSSALPYAIAVEFNPSDADIDAEVTFGHNDLFGANYSVTYSHGDYSVARVYLELNAEIDGYSDVTIRDRNSNLSTTVRVYNCPAGSQSSPRAYFSPSAATFSSAACTTSQSYLDKKIGDLVCVGFNVATVGRSSSYIPSNTSDWWNISGVRPLVSIAADNTFYVVTMGENSGSTRDVNGFYGIQDTNDNFYVLPFYIVQEGSGSTSGDTPTGRNIYCYWESEWTPHTACNGYSYNDAQLQVENCTLDDFSYVFQIISGDSSFTCDVTRTHSVENWEPLGGIACIVSGNTTNETREGCLYVTFRDTDQNEYVQSMIITQAPCGSGPTPSGLTPYVYISGDTAFTVDFNRGASTVYIVAENCDLDTSFVPTFTQTGDIVLLIGTPVVADDKYSVNVQIGLNSGTTSRDSLVTFNVKDTSGNTYPLQINLTQGTGTTVYVDPTYSAVSSDAGVIEYNVYAINCTLTGAGLELYHSSVTGDWSSGPAYVEHIKVSDNHMIVRVAYPQNTGMYRQLNFQYKALTDYGDQYIHFIFGQIPYAPSPGEVSATSITLNVDSSITGSGIATTTVNPSDATVNLRYTSSNSTIATIDQNGRITVVRNGQVTICVKDLITGLQDCKTIRVTKGSSGGDDDDLIYVYTGITVNDNEGHRYNITAEPGYKYGCLGKTYKTVSACEARYSLYYINAYGGVDVLPCKGKSSMKKDNITRYNYSRTFRNNTLEFENTNYLSEIKTTWELHTGYMVDTQSEKMHHLVESTCVFLYDALEQTYTPVVMTDKTLEYKTFHNQGRTFYNYTINIEESQSKERR